jgi:hypothetical protein
MKTMASSVRTSNSKLSCQKSSGTKRKKLEAYRKDFESKGGVWVDKTDTTLNPSDPVVLVDGQEVHETPEKKKTQMQKMIKTMSDKGPKYDIKSRYMHDVTEYFQSEFHERCTDQGKLEQCEKRHIVPFGPWNEPYCCLCAKYSTGGHQQSAEHIKRLNEAACCDEMIGWAVSVRRHSKFPGLPGQCTSIRIKEFWGNSVDYKMIGLLWSRLAKGARFQVDMTEVWGRRSGKPWYLELGQDEVKSIAFGCVSYSGSGKYNESDRVIHWDDLVAEDHDRSVWQLEKTGVDDLHFERLVDDDFDKQKDGGGFGAPVDGTRGWWPVAIIHWKTEARDHGMQDELEYLRQQRLGLRPEYAVGWYQLTDGRWVLVLWRVIARSRL